MSVKNLRLQKTLKPSQTKKRTGLVVPEGRNAHSADDCIQGRRRALGPGEREGGVKEPGNNAGPPSRRSHSLQGGREGSQEVVRRRQGISVYLGGYRGKRYPDRILMATRQQR